jgi:hypothetical protein
LIRRLRQVLPASSGHDLPVVQGGNSPEVCKLQKIRRAPQARNGDEHASLQCSAESCSRDPRRDSLRGETAADSGGIHVNFLRIEGSPCPSRQSATVSSTIPSAT